MGRPVGIPKTGGRKKGTPNRRTLQLTERLEELGLDVPERLAALLPTLPPQQQAQILVQLMSYLYPRRRPSDPAFDPNFITEMTFGDDEVISSL